MKPKFNINFPQKSIFGFEILSSAQSSIACYFFLFFGKILNPFFGLSKIELLAGNLFNLLLNLSIVILIINLFIKRNDIKRVNFIFLNLLLFIYFPIALSNILSNILYLVNFLNI
tara:strand:- start:849 stop:1193 length:345 start_codon:yes stop_codon:yes gene_type:complete